jgi:hypothetical protein
VPAGSGIRRLVQDVSGRVWARTTRLQIFKDGKLESAPLPPNVPDTGFGSLARDTGGGIWIGTAKDIPRVKVQVPTELACERETITLLPMCFLETNEPQREPRLLRNLLLSNQLPTGAGGFEPPTS